MMNAEQAEAKMKSLKEIVDEGKRKAFYLLMAQKNGHPKESIARKIWGVLTVPLSQKKSQSKETK